MASRRRKSNKTKKNKRIRRKTRIRRGGNHCAPIFDKEDDIKIRFSGSYEQLCPHCEMSSLYESKDNLPIADGTYKNKKLFEVMLTDASPLVKDTFNVYIKSNENRAKICFNCGYNQAIENDLGNDVYSTLHNYFSCNKKGKDYMLSEELKHFRQAGTSSAEAF